MSSPRLAKDGSELPNVRKISLALKKFSLRMSSCFSVFQMSFGQFLDHDLTATPTAKGKEEGGKGMGWVGRDGEGKGREMKRMKWGE